MTDFELQKENFKKQLTAITHCIVLLFEEYLNTLSKQNAFVGNDAIKKTKHEYYKFVSSLLSPLHELDVLSLDISKAIRNADKENDTDELVSLNGLLSLCLSAREEIQNYLSVTEQAVSVGTELISRERLYTYTSTLIRRLYYIKI